MPTYKYVAVNLQKQKFKGKFIADNEKDLAVQLAKQNLYLVSSSEYKGGTPSAFFTLGTGKITLSEINTFCRQFAIMLSSGIQIVDCMEILKQQPFTAYFKTILQVISEDVKGGDMLSAAFDKHKKVFPDFFVSMVHVGEASGKLDMVFVSLADYYESDASMRRKAKAALAYPALLACLTVCIVFIMLAFVVPTFKTSMATMEVDPTGLTKIVYDVSDYLTENWRMIVLVIFAIVGILFLFLKTKKGKRAFDIFMVKAPLIGHIQISLTTARFARAFGLLLSSGMDMASALDTISIILGNGYIEQKFNDAATDVRHGTSLTGAFSKQNLFPPMLIQMLSVGEKTASLEETLSRSCSFFDDQVEASLTSITSKIQPTMLIIMGLVIGTLFLAVYSPMLSMMGGLA